MEGSIFLSYRRDDSSGHTGRIYDRLAERLGEQRVFLDIDNIPPGVDFVDAIDRTLDECVVDYEKRTYMKENYVVPVELIII